MTAEQVATAAGVASLAIAFILSAIAREAPAHDDRVEGASGTRRRASGRAR